MLWAAVIFALSSQSSLPQAPEELLDTVVKKLGHFLEYAVLALLTFRTFQSARARVPHAYLYSLGAAFFYAVGDEFHQSLIPGRHPSPVDVTIDTLGAALAMLVLWAAQDCPKAKPQD